MNATAEAVCAALLHDTVEDAQVRPRRLHGEFGAGIATMVEELTVRQDSALQLARAELALISIADRLHNLRTIEPLPTAKRARVALDTLVFHVPLARDLNRHVIAAEMTDLACAALADLDGPGRGERWRHLALTAAPFSRDPQRPADLLQARRG
jgi:(p)ppGpp synthase/HD superfamily hydrolase